MKTKGSNKGQPFSKIHSVTNLKRPMHSAIEQISKYILRMKGIKFPRGKLQMTGIKLTLERLLGIIGLNLNPYES